LSAGGIRFFHLYYSIPWIGVVECYLGAFAVGGHFLDGLAYQVSDGDGGFGIGWSFNYSDVLVAVDLDVAIADVGYALGSSISTASNTML
jgi:hypothetical protein